MSVQSILREALIHKGGPGSGRHAGGGASASSEKVGALMGEARAAFQAAAKDGTKDNHHSAAAAHSNAAMAARTSGDHENANHHTAMAGHHMTMASEASK